MGGDTDNKRDQRVAVALATAWVLLLAFGPYLLSPWGPATPSTRDLAAFWTDVPLVTDFISFWTGASLVREGAGPALFDVEAQRAFQAELRSRVAADEGLRGFAGGAPFFNPPPLALLFVPLTLLPIPWAHLLWSALSLLASLAAVALPLRGRPRALTPAVAMLTYAGVADTLLWGQVNGLFAMAFGLGLLALAAGRPLLGGALLGLLWLKPQQALLFPLVFLLKGRWRELGGMAATGAGIASLSLALVGPEGGARYLEMLQRAGAFYPPASTSITPERMANWRAVLVHLWPGLPEATGSALVLALGAATALVSLLAWRGPWEPASPRFALQMLVVALATIIASPHSHFHGTVILLAPLALAVGRLGARGRRDGETGRRGDGGWEAAPALSTPHWWMPMLWLGYLLALAVWPFRTLSWLLVPYFLVAMGLLIREARAEIGTGSDETPC